MQANIQRRVAQWKRNRADLKLFNHLSQIHELSTKEKDLLIAIANEKHLVRLSEIMVKPSLLRDNPNTKKFSKEDLGAIRKKLLGSDLILSTLDNSVLENSPMAMSSPSVEHFQGQKSQAIVESPIFPKGHTTELKPPAFLQEDDEFFGE